MPVSYDTTPAVDAIDKVAFAGNIIHRAWLMRPELRRDDKKINTVALMLLADCVYWYRPTKVIDEETHQIVKVHKRFREDMWHIDYAAWGEAFGFSERQARDAASFLVQRGLLRREIRNAPVQLENGRKSILPSRVYLEPIPSALERMHAPVEKGDERLTLKREGAPSRLNVRGPDVETGEGVTFKREHTRDYGTKESGTKDISPATSLRSPAGPSDMAQAFGERKRRPLPKTETGEGRQAPKEEQQVQATEGETKVEPTSVQVEVRDEMWETYEQSLLFPEAPTQPSPVSEEARVPPSPSPQSGAAPLPAPHAPRAKKAAPKYAPGAMKAMTEAISEACYPGGGIPASKGRLIGVKAAELLDAGYTASDVADITTFLKRDAFWRDKVTPGALVSEAPRWKAQHRPRRPVPEVSTSELPTPDIQERLARIAEMQAKSKHLNKGSVV